MQSPKVKSLKDISTENLTSLVIQRKLPLSPTFKLGDYIGIVPNDVLSYWSENLQKTMSVYQEKNDKLINDLIKSKIDHWDLDYYYGGSEIFSVANAKVLGIVKEAHELGVCKKFFPNKCHLCGDNFCILCSNNGQHGISDTPCCRCIARRDKKMIEEYTKRASTATTECVRNEDFLTSCYCKLCCLESIKYFQSQYEGHMKGECNCIILTGYPKHPFYPLTPAEVKPEAKTEYDEMIQGWSGNPFTSE